MTSVYPDRHLEKKNAGLDDMIGADRRYWAALLEQ